MKKRALTLYALLLIPVILGIATFCAYQLFYHGPIIGTCSILLTWSMYILCVPAAHGRILLGAPAKLIFKQPIFPEIFLWSMAAILNIVVLMLAPWIYEATVPTYLLYRIFMVPSYRWILLLAGLGTWYRVIIGTKRYNQNKGTHTLIRHLILIVGLFLFFYLTHHELIIMINATATG